MFRVHLAIVSRIDVKNPGTIPWTKTDTRHDCAWIFRNISSVTGVRMWAKEWVRMESVVIIMHDYRRGSAYAQQCPTFDVFSVNSLASQQRKASTAAEKKQQRDTESR